MHAMNKTRNAKGMLKLWRFQPNSFLSKVGRSFAAQTREAMLYAKHMEQRRQAGLPSHTLKRPADTLSPSGKDRH